METQIIDLIQEKKYAEAAEVFNRTPILNEQSEKPVLKVDFFEYSITKNKNPIFLRVLINYISLINILLEQNLSQNEFHETLLYFCAKFTYEKTEDGFLKLILMARTSIEVYNLIFQEDINNVFKDLPLDMKNTIDLNFEKESENDVGYTCQELCRVFLNEYIIGKDKGIELPNILFYIKSINEIKNLIGKLFVIPEELKLNLEEKIKYLGINEYDNVLLLNCDLKIDENNPYFRYIKTFNGKEMIYEDLNLKKDIIYIIEMKHSYTMNKDVTKLDNLGRHYVELFNKSIYDNKEHLSFKHYKILYFYNYLENLGYKNISGYNIDTWKICYIRPSSQIIPVTKLSSKVQKLEKKVSAFEKTLGLLQKDNNDMKQYISSIKKDNENLNNKYNELNEKLEKLISGCKSDNKIENEKVNTFSSDLGLKIEEEFECLSKEIKEEKDINKFNQLFINYEEGINKFINGGEQFEINKKDESWKKESTEAIKDDKTCFEFLAPCIISSRVSSNYRKIQNYFLDKIDKNDEMSEIYKYIYRCFYGSRTKDDKSSPEKFYPKEKNIHQLLINIIKYTFYYDRKRSERIYYFLAIFKELLNQTDKLILRNIYKLKHRNLYQLVLMSIDLINAKNSFYLDGFIECPIRKFI